jgi:hypothetical protein
MDPVGGALELQSDFSSCSLAGSRPSGLLVETLGASACIRRQPQPGVSLLKEPGHHDVVQLSAMSSALVCGLYEERPDVSGLRVADGKPNDYTANLCDPAATALSSGGYVILFRQRHRREPVLSDRQAHAMHRGGIGRCRLPDRVLIHRFRVYQEEAALTDPDRAAFRRSLIVFKPRGAIPPHSNRVAAGVQ